MLGSRDTIHNAPHCDTLSSVSGAPRLYKLAATLVGMAIKSTAPFNAKARSWSGLLHRINSTSSASSVKAWLATKWIKPLDTPAGGPAMTSFLMGNDCCAEEVPVNRLRAANKLKHSAAIVLVIEFYSGILGCYA